MANATTKAQSTTTPYTTTVFKRGLVSTAQTYYPGTMMAVQLSSGYATKCDDTAGLVFDGLLADSRPITVESGGSNGDQTVNVERPYLLTMKIASAAVTDVGRKVYAAYDNEVTYTPGNVLVGEVVAYVNSTSVEVYPAYHRPRQTAVAKTADYTVNAGDSGKLFTTRGASGAVTFTLPAAAAALNGVDVTFFNAVDQDMTVAAATAGQLMFKNDAAANSVAYSTAGEKIGGAFRCVCDGTSWLVMPLAEEAQTISVTT